MAKVNQRPWKIPGQRTKRKAWGFTVQIGKKQVRRYKADWTQADAEKALAACLLGLDTPKPPPTGVTLGQAAERYESEKTRKRTAIQDIRMLRNVLIPFFGKDTPLQDITAARISEFRTHRLATTWGKDPKGRPRLLSPAGVNRPLALIRHLLRLARDEWEVLKEVPRIRMEREPQGRLRWLTPEEASRLLTACRAAEQPDLVDLVEFCLYTGMRQGEALGLAWEQVDRARGVVLLEVTKSAKRREVPLNSVADGVLARRGPKNHGKVFGTDSWYAFRSHWQQAVRRARVENLRFHDLRHTFASWAVQRGASLQEVKELLGHSSLAMVMRYAHLSPDHLRSAVARLDDVLPVTPSAAPSAQPEVQRKVNA